ncbi:MAG: LysR family transcriptional regulator [Arenicella sp.]
MKLDWLHTFLDVSETHNFNRTAERLRITQSTVSSRIRALEDELGMQLFIRGRGGANLTPEGTKFLRYANNIRVSWNQALKEMKSSQSYSGKVYIATQMSIWERLANEWLTGIRQALPKIAVHIEADYSKNMVEELLEGTLDIAVVYAPEYQPDFEIERLFDERFVMLATEPMHISEVNRDNYVFVGLTDYFKERHRELLPHLQPAAVTMGLSIMSLEYLRKNGGAAYISQRQARQLIKDNELYIVKDSPLITQPVFVTYLSRNRHNLVISEVLNVLHKMIDEA